MDAVTKLRRKRGTLRAMVTRAINVISGQLASEEADEFVVADLVAKMNATYVLVQNCDKEIENLVNDENEFDEEITGTIEVLDKVTSTRLAAQRRFPAAITISSTNGSVVEPDVNVNESIDGNIEADQEVEELPFRALSVYNEPKEEGARANDRRQTLMVKLPKLEIIKFNGDACRWQTFWSQFNTAIHRNLYLEKSQKLVYLLSYLVDDALRAVTGLEISDENYDAAIGILQQRFGRRDVVVNAHMKKLLGLTPIRTLTDLRGLRKLYDICEVEIRSLESLGISSSTFGSLLCPVLMNALPEELAFDFQMRRTSTEDYTVDDLLTFLRNVIEAKERASTLTTQRQLKHVNEPEQRNYHRYEPRKPATASTLQTSSDKWKCIFCSRNHSAFQCEKDPQFKFGMLREERRCFVCFGKSHTSTQCKRKEKCSKCARFHHSTVCITRQREEEKAEPKADETIVTTTNTRRAILLQTATAKLGTKGMPTIRILLDGGSETSFILEELSRKNNLPVIEQNFVNVYTFGNEKPTSTARKTVQVTLQSLVNGNKIVINAAESKIISSATVMSPNENLREMMRERNLNIAEVNSSRNGDCSKISILIGSDYYWKVATGRIERFSSTLVAVETIFGWCLQGVAQLCNFVSTNISMHSASDQSLSSQVKAFWDLESLGIVDDSKTENAIEKEIEIKFNDTVNLVNGRYSVSLPWNEKKQRLASNYEIAKRRISYLANKFGKDADLFRKYAAVVNEQIQEGIAEKVKTQNVNGATYYIPHQAVIRNDKATTKLRVVFDASSHGFGQLSLNDCLHCGPNLVPDLVNVLLKFRLKKYGYMADIKRAFLQISVNEEDRDALRFLWFSPDWRPGDDLSVNEYRMTRVLFGATCSPYLLAATIKNHIRKYAKALPDIVQRLETQMYVDDFIGSEATEAELQRVKESSSKLMNDASMELTKWATNSKPLAKEWQDSTHLVNELPKTVDMTTDKILGVRWDRDEDVFSFNVTNIVDFVTGKAETKRNVLKTVSRIFDPLGFITPFTIRVKILFQKMWEAGLEWDATIQHDILNEWRDWLCELQMLEAVKIDRCFENSEVKEKEIHIFSDASEAAYGAVAYFRITFVNGETETKFIISKSRVAPLKKLSLPRLELMGALIAARLKDYLGKLFVNVKCFLWTDAMIVLHWIRGSAKRWKPFVANRVSEIHSLTEPETWNHCSGKMNPADKLTRGIEVYQLVVDDTWWNGPSWLVKNASNWPQTKVESSESDVANELRTVYVLNTISGPSTGIVNEGDFSSLARLLRVTAWIKRFAFNLRNKERKRGALTTEEINESETYWMRHSQGRYFEKEINALTGKNEMPKDSPLAQTSVFVDGRGVLRVKGRLQFSDIADESKHPIVIPRETHLAALIIVNAHKRMGHLGVQSTLGEIRTKYWIPRGRQLIKQVLHKCVTCRKLNAKNFSESFAPLPGDRVSSSTPFNVIGVDFAGPLLLRSGKKVYILLFTCATTRAVHLELVPDMTTETTILAFKRFISRRGIPLTIYSDNGKTFKRMNAEIQILLKHLSSTEMQDWLSGHRIQWKFIVERSPWWGGFWERMVRTVKTTLKKVLGKSSLNFDELATVLIECESVVNNRPLTYTYNDVNEMEALTPSHLVIGKRTSSLPSPAKYVNENSDHSTLLNRWQYRQRLSDHFWRRWQKEYILQLTWRSTKMSSKSLTKPNIGDVVLVREDNLVRQQWILAKIEEVIPGRDNRVRACKVKTSKGSILTRPIQRLYPLEVSSTSVNGTLTVSMGGECCGTSTKLPEESRMFSNILSGTDVNARDEF